MEEMVFPIIIETLVTINEIENNVKLLIFEILVCFINGNLESENVSMD